MGSCGAAALTIQLGPQHFLSLTLGGTRWPRSNTKIIFLPLDLRSDGGYRLFPPRLILALICQEGRIISENI